MDWLRIFGFDHGGKTPAHNRLLFLYLLAGINAILGASLWWGNLLTTWILKNHGWAFKITTRPFSLLVFPLLFILLYLASAYPVVHLKKWGFILLTIINILSAFYFYRLVVSVNLLSVSLCFSPVFFILGATWIFSPPLKKLFKNRSEVERVIAASKSADPTWNLKKLRTAIGLVLPLLFGIYYLVIALIYYFSRK